MFEISPVQYLAPSVEMTLFQCVLIVSIDAVCVVTSPKYSRRSPPAVILVLCISDFSGRISTVYLGYVACLSRGTWYLCIHSSTSIPSTSP